MISTEAYGRILSQLLDELPPEFFRELSGGVIVSEAAPVPDYARAGDLYTMGKYQFSHGMRQIVMFKGSFDRMFPEADADEARRVLRGILRHEFRHHLESLGGVHNSTSLEAEDARKKQAYLSRYRDQTAGKDRRRIHWRRRSKPSAGKPDQPEEDLPGKKKQ